MSFSILVMLRRAIEAISTASLFVGTAGVVLMTVFVLVEITARSVFKYSTPFAVEYTEYLIPVIAIWGAAYTLRREGHVNADILVSRLPDKLRQWVLLIGYVLGLGYLVVLDIHAYGLALASIRLHRVSFYPLRTPLGYAQLILPTGISLFAVQLVIEIIRKARLLYLSYRS